MTTAGRTGSTLTTDDLSTTTVYRGLKCLVAVSVIGVWHSANILYVWPPIPPHSKADPMEASPAWTLEYECVGNLNPEDLGLSTPKEPGLWIWEGKLIFLEDDKVYKGAWRKPYREEIAAYDQTDFEGSP